MGADDEATVHICGETTAARVLASGEGIYFMKSLLIRLSYVAILWVGGGLGSSYRGNGIGTIGWLLGMVSGADLYGALRNQPRRMCLLMLLLAVLGVPCSFAYEHLVSLALPWPLYLRIGIWGIVMGCLFGLASSGVGFACGART